uniref:Polycystic kidney disease 1 like 3 n=1 Tax=Jaculus jaculus TaxID=51337 RepID=A0A8C5L6G2_JACJA
MFFQRSTWPWLYMTVGVILGHKQSKSEQDGKSQCFQFNRVHCSFEEAKAYCHKQGGRLAQAWKQEIKAVIQSSLEEGSWWWVEQNPKQRKHQGTSHPGNGIPWGVSKYGKCTSVFKSSEDMSSKQDQCAQKHYFICQAGRQDLFGLNVQADTDVHHVQEGEAAGHFTSTARKQRERWMLVLTRFLSFIQSRTPVHQMVPPASVAPPRHYLGDVSWHADNQYKPSHIVQRVSKKLFFLFNIMCDSNHPSSIPPQTTAVTPVTQVTSVIPVSRNPSQVTLITTIPRRPSQVTSFTPASSSPPQVTSVTPASRNPSQVTLVTTIPSSPPQVTSVTPAARSPPQVTSVTPAASSPPQVTLVTPVSRNPSQVTLVTTISSSPSQVTSVTPAASSPPQVMSVTPAASSPPQVTSVTPAASSPPQVMLVTPLSRNPSQVTLVTTIPSSPSQVMSVTPPSSSPPQVTSVTPAASSPPQVTSVTPASSSPPQVTSVTPASSSPPQVMSVTPAASSPPQVTSVTPAASSPPQEMSDLPAPNSLPQSVITEPTRPVSAAPAGRPLVDITSRSKEDSHPSVITTHPQASFQNASNQVLNETAGKFGGAIPGLQAHSRLKKACDILQKRRHFTPTFPAPDQVSVIDLLTDLSDQLLMLVPLQENSSWSSKTPARICLFSPLNSEAQGKKESQQPKQDTEKVEDMLETSLMALGEIQEAFLQQSPFAESSVTLTSSVATLVFSSQNISTLPLSSYTLGDPAPVRLGFPSAAALKALWNNHLGINVQVTGLAFNPFKTLDNRSIAGSVGSVLLSSGHETLQVHDLMEDVEIMLWRNSSMEIHPTTFRTSTDRFIITMNVTSLEKSLIVTIDPESPLLMTLYLGFQYQPDHTHFHLNITLPKDHVWQKDEEYTWVLTPESLQYGIGTYYITAMVNKRMEATLQTPVLVSVVTGITQCYFWDKYNRTWNSNGCQVGSQSTVWKTQCLCNHLTFFSSDFFIVPRTVDIEDTVKLFLHVTNNPVGVSLLASLLGFYMILVVWAWRKDQLDMQKVKVTVLADNDPSAQFHYLIQVYTGYRRRAATTAKVVITLYGSEGRSDPHHLCDPQKTVFERGALDVFLLTTESSLGELHGLRLWHDNSGSSPSWFVSQVVVSDMALKRKWHFLCNCWLAEDLGDCEHDGVFMPATKRDLLSFRHLFSSMIIEKFTQDYLWLSVATRHPWNQLTRVKRLTCCMTLLLCDMVINVMFWKMGGTAAKRDEQIGPFTVTWSELLISIQTTVILLPVHLVIERLFLLIQPQEALPPLPPMQASCPSSAAGEPPSLTVVVEELKETVGFLLRRNIRLLSECDLSLWSSCNINKLVKLLSSLIYSHLEDQGRYQQAESHWANVVSETHHHFCCYLLKVLLRLKSHLGTLGLGQVHQPCNFSEAASQLQKLQELLETQILPREQRPCRNTTSFPILSPEEGKQPISTRLLRWLTYISWLLLSVISLASAFFTALYSLELNKDQAASWVISMILSVLQDIFISQPVKVTFFTFLFSLMVSWMPWLHKDKEQQTKKIVALWAKCSSSLPGLRDKNNPIYTAPTMSSPAKRPKKAWTKKKLFKLTGDILVQIIFLILLMTAVYSAKNSNKFFLHQAIWKSFSRSFSDIKLLEDFYPWANQTLLPNLYGDYRGFITDGNNFLLGNVLLRQIRITNATFFPVSFQNPVKPYYHHQEDMKNYRVGWGPPDTNSTKSDSIWHYQNQESLGGNPIQGEFATYSGGGYVVRLGRTSSTATRILQHLEQMHWLDHCTKALFVEFVVFNANVNLFCVVTLILESNNVGMKISSLALTGCRLKRQKWKFLTRRRNILDTSIILISFSILGLDMKRISLHHKNMMQYHLDQDRFISFHETLKVSSAVTHLMGFLVLLATVQLWDLLRHNPRFQVINKTLSKAWDEVMGFLLIILILLTSYAMTFNLLFGWSISDYQSFFSSAVNVIGLLMGISPHKEVIALYPVLGPLLILTSVILMGLTIINLFISAILIAFGKERKSLKKEAALTDMLLQKLSDLLGIHGHDNGY